MMQPKLWRQPLGRSLALWLVPGLASLFLSAAFAGTLPGPLVETEWLEENLDQVVVLDVRKDVDSFTKRPRGAGPVNPCGPGGGKPGDEPLVVAGHIPGAVLVPWKDVTTKREIDGVQIKVLVPDKEQFERLMQESGVNNASAVVITSKGQTPVEAAMAARLYWTLKYFGHDDVALLNGGTAQWMLGGDKVTFARSRPDKGDFTADAERAELLATADDVMKLSQGEGGDGQLVDVREKDVYLGLTRTAKFVPPEGMGHIPGAKSFPTSFMTNTLGPAAWMYSKEQMDQVAKLVGVDLYQPSTTYCNTGVYASLGWFALHELVGNENVKMYDGSMHEWSNTGRPVVALKID